MKVSYEDHISAFTVFLGNKSQDKASAIHFAYLAVKPYFD